jgi:hypothetical protein
VFRRVETIGRKAGEGLEALTALTRLRQRAGERALFPTAPLLLDRLEFLFPRAKQPLELGLRAGAVAGGVAVAVASLFAHLLGLRLACWS